MTYVEGREKENSRCLIFSGNGTSFLVYFFYFSSSLWGEEQQLWLEKKAEKTKINKKKSRQSYLLKAPKLHFGKDSGRFASIPTNKKIIL
jgi:hypothetical protein